MLKKSKLLLLPLMVLVLFSSFNQNPEAQSSSLSGNEKYHIFDMPFEFAGSESHTGPATLAMLFNYYGFEMDQEEFMNVSSTNAPGIKGTPNRWPKLMIFLPRQMYL